jgi:hypothetical protein
MAHPLHKALDDANCRECNIIPIEPMHDAQNLLYNKLGDNVNEGNRISSAKPVVDMKCTAGVHDHYCFANSASKRTKAEYFQRWRRGVFEALRHCASLS